ncbi:hypothetical protein ABEQ76_20620 [Bacillus velezensis]|uniref:hypothetical protein n=1 Tax=Bacillus TaxID=1386 RepID=UPI001331AD14|nr:MULTISPECIES: hypothetical protein [Bacillus amyloliquefaciens group]MDL0428703.1 hypothetical protein [Bacillus amyloliquefaciens]NRF33755.1 hypothetical protein [Bacillus velezensis]
MSKKKLVNSEEGKENVVDRKREFRNAFFFMKRWAKAPLLPSYTIGYSRGNADKEPAKLIYEYILSLQENSSITFEKKVDLLDTFLEKANQEQRGTYVMGTGMYNNFRSYIRRSLKDIEDGIPVQTRKK